MDATDEALAAFRLGLQDLEARRFEAARSNIERALALSPGSIRFLYGLGKALEGLGRPAEAAAAYRRLAQAEPRLAEVHDALGTVLHVQGDLAGATTAYRNALECDGRRPLTLVNLGVCLCGLRRLEEADSVLERAAGLDPALPEAAFNRGNALLGLGRARDAAEQYRRALALRPGYADAQVNLGNALRELGEAPAALAAFEAAVRIDPGCSAALNNAGGLYRSLGRLEDAERALREALAMDEARPATLNNLGNVLRDSGCLAEAIACFRRAVHLDPADAVAHSNLAYTLAFQETDGRAILAECLRWNARHGAALFPVGRVYPNDPSPERRLRVGYVSGDLRDHCTAQFTLPLFERHERTAFEIFAYASVVRPDAHTRRFQHEADGWRDVAHLTDEELAGVIARDRIDLLVDLGMHMSNGRPLLFARKPAPVQLAWVAYPGTTGISGMDYVLSDPRLAPPELWSDYSETVFNLPDTFWCYDPLADGPPVSELPSLAGGPVTFGCLNATCKITDRAMELWGRVMAEVKDSRLLVMAPNANHRQFLLDRLSAHGVAPARVEIQPFRPRTEYLRTYHRIDIALDTFPYNGHTTSLDSFWMGVPVVTRVGRTAVSRAGLSQLHNLDLTELAAETDEGFVAAAVRLASDRPALAALRGELRTRMQGSPLMDTARFARHMEDAYRELWRRWCASGHLA